MTTIETPATVAGCGAAALACQERGWSVLALRPRDKRPLLPWELLLAWNQARCRPPLPAAEVAALVRHIGRLHDREGSGERHS